MPSLKDLRKRISSVKNTQQTTKAMKMVSAAKLRRAQEAILSKRPYAQSLGKLLSALGSMPELSQDSPFFHSQRMNADGTPAPARALLVLVTSDRGLCGSFNASMIKTAQRWVDGNLANYPGGIDLAFVGRRGNDYFKKRKQYSKCGVYQEFGSKVQFAHAKTLSDQLMELFLKGEYSEIKVLYNEFKNAISQKPTVEEFLPVTSDVAKQALAQAGKGSMAEVSTHDGRMTVSPREVSAASGSGGQVTEVPTHWIVKPSPAEVFHQILKKNFGLQIYRMLLESQASEHGARMTAMDNATRNAGEMIRKITLVYNKTRQAAITKELLEITSGAEAQKG